MSADETAEHRHAVKSLVELAIRDGCNDLSAVLLRCDGADPNLVWELYEDQQKKSTTRSPSSNSVYVATDGINPALPAPDPQLSQWWFTGSTVDKLKARVRHLTSTTPNPRSICIGAPTLGTALKEDRFDVETLDVDADLSTDENTHVYDVADPLPNKFLSQFDVAIADPPWYDDYFYTFLNRCLSALKMNSHALITFPGSLTRPGLGKLHSLFQRRIIEAGHEIASLVPGALRYQVPLFEFNALAHLDGFRGVPWRPGDLIEVIKRSETLVEEVPVTKSTRKSFHRKSSEFRIFMSDQTRGQPTHPIEIVPDYSRTVSKRNTQEPDIWSSEKIGAIINNSTVVASALTKWAAGQSKQETINDVAKTTNGGTARLLVEKLDEIFSLWSRFGAEPPLRNDKDIKQARQASLTNWATSFSMREHAEKPDGFRTEFQRDRDRILWSSGLRRLSNKTQLFPVEHDDDLRQRLTHSVEVLQIASTIGTSFGLDNDLIEAGALAHDIGHTPFGHAGEHALDRLFNVIQPELGGFNHYEHGVDVIRYLEAPYYSSKTSQFSGLNLSSELCECVIKHTYCHKGPSELSAETLRARSKHNDIIPDGFCHLEGQAVRVADKVSYLISDLEDGIRLGAISQSDLLSCRFFHRPPLHFEGTAPLAQQFGSQRRVILKILIEDILQSSNHRLARIPLHADGNRVTVRNAEDYLVQYSEEMDRDVSEIWTKVQTAKLHKDRRVVSAGLQAARIVSELTTLFALMPELIEERFFSEYSRLIDSKYMDTYKRGGKTITFRPELCAFLPMHLVIGKKHEFGKPIVIPVEHLIMAKDYVAALSDSRARLFHAQVLDFKG